MACAFLTVLYGDIHYPLIQTKGEPNTKTLPSLQARVRNLILGLFQEIYQHIFQYFNPETLLEKLLTLGVWASWEVKVYIYLWAIFHISSLLMILSDGKEPFNTLFKLVPVNSVNLGQTQNTSQLIIILGIIIIDFDEI